MRIEGKTAKFSEIRSHEMSCHMVVHATKKVLTTTSASRSVIRLPIRVTVVSQGSIIALVMSLTASRILITQTVRKEEVPRIDENIAIEGNVLPEWSHEYRYNGKTFASVASTQGLQNFGKAIYKSCELSPSNSVPFLTITSEKNFGLT